MSKAPDFLIIGAQKAGTGAAKKLLNKHPQIYLPETEVHFFDKETNYANGIGWYEDLFFDNLTCGEKCPAYMADATALNRIKTHYPNVKLLILLRDPVTRFLSNIKFKQKRQIKAGRQASTVNEFVYSEVGFFALWKGMYAEQLKNIYSLFSKEQVHIVFNEAMRIDSMPSIDSMLNFLHVGVFPETDNQKTIKTKRPNWKPNPDLEKHLIKYYKTENERLFDLLQAPQILEWHGMENFQEDPEAVEV